MIVINPLREVGLVRFRVPSDWRSMLFGSDVSDFYLQPHVGADIALLTLLLQGVIARGAVDDDYVRAHTAGWEACAGGGRGRAARRAARGVRRPARRTSSAPSTSCAARGGVSWRGRWG